MFLEAGIAMVILLPVFLLLHLLLIHSWRRTLGYLIFAFYLAAVDSVVGLPNIHYIRFDLNVNLVPMAYMFSDYRTSLLNVMLFLPLGFLLPVLCPGFEKFWKTALFGLCLSLLIELLQIFTFRATDINDLMTNTAGTILGWWAGQALAARRGTCGWKARELFGVSALTLGIMFFMQPYLVELLWRTMESVTGKC